MTIRYTIMESAAQLSGNARNYATQYRRVALVKYDSAIIDYPARIDSRQKGVLQILYCSNVFRGKATSRSEYAKEMAWLQSEKERLENSEKIAGIENEILTGNERLANISL